MRIQSGMEVEAEGFVGVFDRWVNIISPPMMVVWFAKGTLPPDRVYRTGNEREEGVFWEEDVKRIPSAWWPHYWWPC